MGIGSTKNRCEILEPLLVLLFDPLHSLDIEEVFDVPYAANIEDSFLAKRPEAAFPVKRLAMDERAEGPDHRGSS